MQSTKKTLTTLSVAALMAIGGIAVAQTTSGEAAGPNVNDPSTATSTMGAGAAPSTEAATTTTTTDTSTLGASTSTPATTLDASAPVAQVDRN